MKSIVGSCAKWFPGFIRREYTRNMEDGHGDYLPCIIHGLRVIQGRSLEFQCVMTEGDGAGAGFLAPIEAYCWKRPARARLKGEILDHNYIQPWDCFSSTFDVHEFEFHRRMRCFVLPGRIGGRYRFTIDFAGSALAEFAEQHKHLHIVDLEDGQVAALPNNRILWNDPAFWTVSDRRPDFKALSGEWMAE